MLDLNVTHPCDDCQKSITLEQAHPTCICRSPHVGYCPADHQGIGHKMIYVCSDCALERGIPVNSHSYIWP